MRARSSSSALSRELRKVHEEISTGRNQPKYTFKIMHPEIRKYLSDPLYENSFYLVLSRFFNSAAGFFFWMIAA
ncbi:MAG TPA: hypothetical protein VIO11_05715, partial [Candidatus Methanoperedens sp.]